MKKDVYELTSPQKSIWYTEQFYKDTAINSICGTALINEPVDFDLLKLAILHVVQNNQSFGLKFVLENSVPKQYFSSPTCDIEFVCVDSMYNLEDFRKTLLKQPFSIEDNFLFKFYLIKFPNKHGAFILNIHHLISDAWTLALVSNEVIKNYYNLKNNLPLITYETSYLDYIVSEQNYLNSDKFNKDRDYWNTIFETVPEVATLPGTSSNKLTLNSCVANRKMQKLDHSLMDAIRTFCQENRVSVFNFFMAVFSIYIGRACNLEDFVIGTPILNRCNYHDKNTFGMFISTMPFRIQLKNHISFKDFVAILAKDSLTMLRHQKYPYANLLEDLRKENKNIPNLYNILLSYQITNAKNNQATIDYTTQWTFNGNCADPINIHLFDLNDTGDFDLAYDYQTAIYTANDINCIHNRVLNIIQQVLSAPSILLKEIEIVTPEEKQKMLFDFNQTSFSYDDTLTVVDLFEEQVKKTPNKTALVSNGISLSYEQLNQKANILANYLRNTYQINPKDIIGIMLNRSPEMIIGLLAILKCGATYLPIDPEYPEERISYMLKNSDTRCCSC